MTYPNNNLSIVGRLFEADFGKKAFTLFYENANRLILTEVRGTEVGKNTEVVGKYRRVEA